MCSGGIRCPHHSWILDQTQTGCGTDVTHRAASQTYIFTEHINVPISADEYDNNQFCKWKNLNLEMN